MKTIDNSADRTRKWRESLRERRIPESDDVDTAAAQALAIYLASVERTGTAEGHQVSEAIRAVVERVLVRSGYDDEASAQRASARLYYLQMLASYPNAPASQRKLWERGPLPDDFTNWSDDDEPKMVDDWSYEEQDDDV